MNTYTYRFEVSCPNNGERIAYQAEINVNRTIMAENIAGFFSSLTSAYHEEIAESAYEAFGGHQIISAHHHGVDVKTERGGSGDKPSREAVSGFLSACYCDLIHMTCSYCRQHEVDDPRFD